MSALNKVTKVSGTISPIYGGTRLRVEPSTYTGVVKSYGTSDVLSITEEIEYLESDSEKTHIQAGDVWGKVKADDGNEGHMAIMYHGTRICNTDYQEVDSEPVPLPEPTIVYPDIVLVGPAGGRKEYIPNPSQTELRD